MKNEQQNKIVIFKLALFIFVFCITFSSVFTVFIKVVRSQPGVIVSEPILEKEQKAKWSWENMLDKALKQLKKVGSKALQTTVRTVLKQMAYDTATYLASGGEGQKPLFYREGWSGFLSNVADNAAGTFIEQLGREWGPNFNLCEPSLMLKVKIGLGLASQQRPGKPACTFSEMKENWEEELQSGDFLTKFQDMFEPQSSDLGIALSLQTGIMESKSDQVGDMTKEREEGQGWLDLRNIAGLRETFPGEAKTEQEMIQESWAANMAHYTGDALVDAANVFLNQYAITLIQRKLRELAKDAPTITSKYAGDYGGFTDYEAGPTYGGIAGAKERFREIIQPDFTERGDYNILTELVMCPDPNKAGPTNCVIIENFRQAIESKMTVGQALKQGYLNANGVFGFTADGLEPPYNEGYPYRSIIILRKFRIIPVGWEVAGQYIKDYLGETRNLGDLVACFSNNDDYNGYYASWCDGLVDPSWVLKAPLNYCKREGPGPEIVSELVIGEGEMSELAISRNSNYCADEQTCIKENDDGSCQLYGYCTEERRKWNFAGKSCEPKYNTCQTFRSRDGKTFSYLENTLDYSICNIDNIGCRQYAISYTSYNPDTDEIIWNDDESIFFDKDAEQCQVGAEGCHEFIRTKAGRGANLLTNSSFEEDIVGSIWEGDGTQVDDSYDGLSGLQMSATISKTIIVGPTDYSISGQVYTLSVYAKDCSAGNTMELDSTIVDLSDSSSWQNYQVTHFYPLISIGNQVDFTINSNSCLIDAIKLERGDTVTTYSEYRGDGLVYQRLAPEYLNCSGVGDPIQCYNFVRECTRPEVGCELYTSVKDSFSIPAKVTVNDYCPAECVGYDEYLQSETYFEDPQSAYFIPGLAQSCSAQSVGCDEFTNLDKLELGGEAREYYSQLKLCRKPDNECAQFYTWEGSAETGYQLRIHSLRADGNGPYLTNAGQYNGQDCNDINDYDLTNNPMCREFYNTNGEVFYRFYPYIITCSENCHPYRRTEVDNPGIGTCLNGGAWNDEHEACIYMAIPGEGVSCSAAQAGCREYSGSAGANMRILFTNDFEDGTNQGWDGANSNESIMVGEHSLAVSGNSTYLTVDHLVARDQSYVVSFMAKSNGANNFTQMGFGESAAEILFDLGSAMISGEWRLYEFNLARLNNSVGDYEISDEEKMFIEADGNFYIDDIRLTEIIDRYYLIKDSWNIPEACLKDIHGNPVVPEYNLGCEAYQDRDNNTHYLRQFSQLCQESAVGCELMIDTYNSTDYASTISNTNPAVNVPEDSFIYVVYDANKQCNQGDKGCQRFGASYLYATTTLYSDVYLKNDPDSYQEILCDEQAVGCEEWYTNEGNSYFKDPGDTVCEWRQAYQESYGWYKKKVKRCDDNGSGIIEAGTEITICLDDNDCGPGLSCILDDNDYACLTSPWLTFGYGGLGHRVEQPLVGWSGYCPASQIGCTELIDPISKFSTNVIFNSDFTQDVDGNGEPDGWGSGNNQDVELAAYSLYRLAGQSLIINNLTISCPDNLYELGSNNYLITASPNLSLALSAGEIRSKLFYSANNTSCVVSVDNTNGQTELKKLIVDYQLRQNLDYESCNGIVNFEEGCVLFNERRQSGSSLASLDWDADLTIDDGNGVTPQAGIDIERDANTLLKVSPDRVCNKWLACRSYIKDENDKNLCFDMGLCDSVDKKGDCNSFVITSDKVNQTYPVIVDNNKIRNLSGYNKVGYSGSSLNSDYFPLDTMSQEGGVVNMANGNFEIYDEDNYPSGWTWEDGTWNEGVFRVIDNPIEAQEEGIVYPLEGRSFLKLGAAYSATSEFIDIIGGPGGVPYILTAYINTINLSSDTAEVKIQSFNNIKQYLGDLVLEPSVYLPASSNDWVFKLGKFNVPENVSKIKVTLYSSGSPEGCSYFDDLRIRPALESKDLGGGSYFYTPQSCRLYPQSDSLACDYYEDSGKRQKGWLGYCLEYDRYPGSSDACLLWMPVDKVKGEGIEEGGAAYYGRFPLYYCMNMQADFDFVEERREVLIYYTQNDADCWLMQLLDFVSLGIIEAEDLSWEEDGGPCQGCGCGYGSLCPDGYSRADVTGGSGCDWWKPWEDETYWLYIYCRPSGAPVASIGSVNWYRYNGDLQNINGISGTSWNEADTGVKIYDYNKGKIFEIEDYEVECQQISQVVANSGENKAWMGRANMGSDYIVDEGYLSFDYDTHFSPFGALRIEDSIFNPYEWRVAIKGSPYSCNGNQCDDSGYCDTTDKFCIVTDNFTACANPFNRFVISEFECPAGETCVPGRFEQSDSLPMAEDALKRLFAQSYGTWQWNGTNYVKVAGYDWVPPDMLCPGGLRPDCVGRDCYICPGPNCNYCALTPIVSNIKANDQIGDVAVAQSSFVVLTFNSDVDTQQLPLIMYAIYWGDGEGTVVTGIEMWDRFNPDNPHMFYHLYSYWDLKAKAGQGITSIECADAGNNTPSYICPTGTGAVCENSNYCVIKPKVKIKDNWGWCNAGIDEGSGLYENPTGIDDCNQWEAFAGWIVVTER